MSILASMVGVLALACVLVGYGYWAWRALRVDACFVPALVMCGIGVLVYAGGIFGVLVGVTWAVIAGGLGAFGCMVYDLVRNPPAHVSVSLFGVCFAVGTVLFLGLLPGAHLEHYDNFSHWATAVKVLLSTGAFPTPDTKLIEFSNYPLGTTSWLYFFCTLTGRSEGMMLLGQGALIFALFGAVFGAPRHKRSFLLYLALAAGCSVLSVFNVTIRINNLLVDFILPLAALACWAVIDRYHDTRPRLTLALLVPIQAFLLVVKSTGAVFVAFVALYYVMRSARSARKGCPGGLRASLAHWGMAACALVASFSTYALWQWHMKTAMAGVTNKFDVASAAQNAVAGGKTPEQVHDVVCAFVQAACDLTTRPALGFVAINVVVIAVLVGLRALRGLRLRRMAVSLALLDAMVVAYYAGILAMYVLSMPLDEALTVAGFDRYACSIIVLFAGGVVLAGVGELEAHMAFDAEGRPAFSVPAEKRAYQKAVVVCLACALGLLTSEYNGMRANAEDYDASLPSVMQKVTGDRWYAGGAEDTTRYLFFGSDADGRMTSYYFTYVARYYMYAPNIDAICAFYEPNMDNLLAGYDVLVVVEPSSEERALLQAHYGVSGDAGFYRVVRGADGGVGLVPEQF